ncbi:MAG: thiamine phosphate synthase [Flavobacteriales bacterium]
MERKAISPLHFISNDDAPLSHSEQVLLACKGGVRWIQVRMKKGDDAQIEQEALDCLHICLQHHAVCIINDRVELAARIAAHGVHLGKEDISPRQARKLLGNHAIIGGTANTLHDIRQLVQKGVDYIGLGPYRFTATKQLLAPLLGQDGYITIFNNIRQSNMQGKEYPPIIAIGGICLKDVKPLMETGIHGIAVSSAIADSGDIPMATSAFVKAVKQIKTANTTAQ